MKRIAICCDGTWNRLDAANVTNVVRIAEAIDAHSADGTHQIVYYDEGVGSGAAVAGKIDRFLGGAFGSGLMQKVEQAYRFLVFNYEPGDEIYIFGFSRGAFTARSLAGLIRNSGIVQQSQGRRLRQALDLYRQRDGSGHPDADESCRFRSEVSPAVYLNARELAWRRQNIPAFDEERCLPIRLRYVGVWDTVGALGVPNHFWISGIFNKSSQFHDANLSSTVESARHAVAIDEFRRSYEPSLWDNLDLLNASAHSEAGLKEARYQQSWFSGDHSSIGGGGDTTAHSSAALIWIAEGAQVVDLKFRKEALEAARKEVDHLGSLRSHSSPGLLARVMSKAPRTGPSLLEHVSHSARLRWQASAEDLPEKALYRPEPLAPLTSHLDRWNQSK